jgi:Zn-dependent protease
MGWFQNIDWVLLATLIPVLVFSMTLHELAHGLAAYKLGDPTAKMRGRLTLNPLKHLDPLGTAMFFITAMIPNGFIFGWAKPIPVAPYYFKSRQRGMMLVGLVGPLTNFALAIVFAVVLNLLEPVLNQPDPGAVREWLFTLLFLALEVNVVLGIFNLIPVPPLDGSRIVGGFLPKRAYDVWVSIDRYGTFIIIILLVLISSSALGDRLSDGYWALFQAMLPAYQ